MKALVIVLLLLLLIIVSYSFVSIRSGEDKNVLQTNQDKYMEGNLKILSPAFANGATIPAKYTCDGENTNPHLLISGVPEKAKSLVLIMEDPDVPKSVREDGLWVHWVKFNMPIDLTEIPQGTEPQGTSGITTSGKLTYGGPCPPDKEHRYFFKLYALDTTLELPEGSTKQEVEEKMKGYIVEEAVLMGKYERS